MEVVCVEIEVGKDDYGDLWGSIVWFNVIIIIFKGFLIVYCLGFYL